MFSKKTAVAVALMAAAAAQAQVTVYGNVDAFFGRIDLPGQDKATTNVESDVATGSFIGFKGQEDLGAGLKAFFKLENAFAVDTGTVGTFWGRTSELGLAGDFGSVKLGNSLSLGFLANHAYNPFSATGFMSTSQVLNGHGAWANSVTYNSPNMSGFTAAAQIGLSERDSVDNSFGLQLNYAAGPLGLGFTYSDEETTVGSLADAFELDAADLGGSASAAVNAKRWQLGASYDFGAAKLFGQLGQNKIEVAGVAGSATGKFFQIGVAVPVSEQGTVVASFARHKIEDAKLRDFSIAYDHALSKRTNVYVGLKNLSFNFAEPESGTTFGVGVRHAF